MGDVVVAAGVLSSAAPDAVHFPHRWTADGITVQAPFTGAHLLHLAAAGCVLNDVCREAEHLGVSVGGVRVTAPADSTPTPGTRPGSNTSSTSTVRHRRMS